MPYPRSPSSSTSSSSQLAPEKFSDSSNKLRTGRRQTMTAREFRAFDEMFEMIFDAVADPNALSTKPAAPPHDAKVVETEIADDILGKLNVQRQRREISASDQELDRHKEAINLCQTDQKLLEWALEHVFAESQKGVVEVEEEARKSATPSASPFLHHASYPHVIALLMRTFRDKFRNPHLALAIFDHVRHLSVASYVFGCTTPAYNQLLETRWSSFHDLKGVQDALQDMVVHGVPVDAQTRKLLEIIRREIGQSVLSLDNEEGTDTEEKRIMFHKIEQLVLKPRSQSLPPRKEKLQIWDDRWKSDALQEKEVETWSFDNWEPSRKSVTAGKKISGTDTDFNRRRRQPIFQD